MLKRNIKREVNGTGIYSQDCEMPNIGNSVFHIKITTSIDHTVIKAKNKMDKILIAIEIHFFAVSENLS